MKVCNGCKTEHPLSDFGDRNGRPASLCRGCEAERVRSWYASNKKRISEKRREKYIQNLDAITAKLSAYRAANREKINSRNRARYQLHRERILDQNARSRARKLGLSMDIQRRAKASPRGIYGKIDRSSGKSYTTCRKHADPFFRIVVRFSKRIREVLHEKVIRKNNSTFAILGYTREELRSHLERQFTDGMTWRNYGEWHVDHIRPVSSFTLCTEKDIAAAWALPNLRPLWAKQNLKKRSRALFLI